MEEKISCDGGHEFKLLLSCPSGLSPSQVSVVFDEAYDRIPHSDSSLEHSISEIWDARVQQSSSLYNGTKFRYGGYNFDVGNDPKQQPHVSLQLGLTDYRTFVGTNLSPIWERYLVPSEDDCIQCQHTSSPLGNGAVVETSDKKILVLQRSNKVGEFPGYFVFPGGHPEPQEVGIISHEGFQELNQCRTINNKVSQEMFDSIVREVVEEIGAPADSLSSPIFIGISRRVMNVRPTAFFFIKCNLQSDEIQQLYSSAQDGFESTQLYAVSMSDLENMASKMPGCHRGGFALYKLMVQGQNKTFHVNELTCRYAS
ncbi:nudix hydrolase 9 isoform X3 [Nicotiana sylvestris]|uniref:Nudix hydrolase 9-like isoform X2 n=1 Tax=Nicotiana sylvestris TaxID=4096 RepID=A0A1U7WUP6_NICSY|nr:PREDICTED: nudix hydrolase 9-like isoform X2 [Nicotiana sylvestris]XP_009782329.1 PREDICTED: nudix hydrolase 9-like isoform X2 [Nicotiana sylvestris]